MSNTSNVRLARIRVEGLRTHLMHSLGAFVGRIPLRMGNRVADTAGDIVYYVARKSRRAAIDNMRHVLGPNTQRPRLRKAVRGIFRNVMRNYFDLTRAPYTPDVKIDRSVDFDWEGWARVVALQEKKVGVILVTAHFGSFDMMTQVITRRNLPLTVLIARISPSWLSDFVTDLRGTRGLDLVEVEEEVVGGKVNLGTLKKMVGILRSGGMLGVLADRNNERTGVHICFFGHDTVVAAGVAKMALRAKAAVVPTMCLRLPGDRYSLTFTEPIMPPEGRGTTEEVNSLLTEVFSRFEQYIGQYPEQWVILQPVWQPK